MTSKDYKVYVKGYDTVLTIRRICISDKSEDYVRYIVYFENEGNDISTYDSTHPTDIGAMALFIANRILGDESFVPYAKVRY